MLLEQMVEVKWYGRTREWYESKGYTFTKLRDIFYVNVHHLEEKCASEVTLICDFCGDKCKKRYIDILKSRNNGTSKKDICKSRSCRYEKQLLEATLKQERGELTQAHQFYWWFEENRLKELLSLAKDFGDLNNITQNSRGILTHRQILHYDGSIENLLSKNGLNMLDYKTKNLEGYYNNFENLQNKIEDIIQIYSRFPTRRELQKEGVANTHIMKFGGMYEVKKRMGYNDERDLIDDSGTPNRSSYEYILAQWFIHNNINYTREQLPFPDTERKFRSDFTINDKFGVEHQIEIWGYGKDSNSKIGKIYKEKREAKERLYKKYNINLIEIEYTFFKGRPLNQIHDALYLLFSYYIDIENYRLNLV